MFFPKKLKLKYIKNQNKSLQDAPKITKRNTRIQFKKKKKRTTKQKKCKI